MKTIRRLYFYAVAFISIEVVLWGLIGLLRSIINTQDIANHTSNLAQALALIFVGIPIFLIHWVWAQKASAHEEDENSASVRAIFLYSILLATLIPVVQNLLALIDRTVLYSAQLSVQRAVVGGSQSWVDNLIAIFINLVIAAYFWHILQANWRTLSEQENFAEIRRLYRFLWMSYALLMTLYGAQQAILYAFSFPTVVLGDVGRETAVNAISLMLIGTPIWFHAWRLLQDGLADSTERESYLRLGLLYIISIASLIIFLVALGNLLYLFLLQLVQAAKPWSELIRQLGSELSVALPFGVVWSYYSHWLHKQFEFDASLPHRAAKHRLYLYILSFLGLASLITGVLSLFSVLIDLALGATYLSSSGLAEPLAGALATILVGLPLWWVTWRPMQGQALDTADVGAHARRSIIRKSYLYLVLFAAVIGSMVAAGSMVFDLVSMALGGSANIWNDLWTEITALVVFLVLLAYHFMVLRADGAGQSERLAEKQPAFQVLVFAAESQFGNQVKAAFAKRALQVQVVDVAQFIQPDQPVSVVIMPGGMLLGMPDSLTVWLRSFDGNRFILSDEAAGVWGVSDVEQVADAVKAISEGQEVRPHVSTRPASAWVYVAYVFAALFALQLLFMVLMLGISLVSGV